jgi:hypothetical protein
MLAHNIGLCHVAKPRRSLACCAYDQAVQFMLEIQTLG